MSPLGLRRCRRRFPGPSVSGVFLASCAVSLVSRAVCLASLAGRRSDFVAVAGLHFLRLPFPSPPSLVTVFTALISFSVFVFCDEILLVKLTIAGKDICLRESEVIERLNFLLHEPRNNTHFRVVLLARAGHFAGCVFDGNSVVVHKTFHRYVVRAKAGKKQSSKDASGRTIHSAGASLRRYNELALKKRIYCYWSHCNTAPYYKILYPH
ncbi:hypothetical protein ACOSQ3_032435 [Xanthoceras sorbifolium]